MAVVTSDYLSGVLTNFRALFEKDFEASMAQQIWPGLVAEMPSDGEQNTYTWFGTVPQMQDVTHDSVEIGSLNRYNFSIVNNEYQAAIEVQRAAMERDRLGLISPRISQLSEEAARHPGQLIWQMYESNPTAYDGTALFANSRVIGGSGTIDNLLAGSGTSIAQFQTDLGTARAAMRLYQDDQARPMDLLGNYIVIPPALEQMVWQALNTVQGDTINNRALPASSTGQWQSSGYWVCVNPYLTDVNDWYLHSVSGATRRPWIYQIEKKPVVESDINPLSREAILQRNYLYSVYGRYNVGPTDPRYSVKIVNS